MKKFLFLVFTCSSIYLSQGQCTSTVSNFPFAETFESGTGLWTQAVDDGFNWTRQTGGTPTAGTGPAGAANGNYYLFTDSRSPNSPWKTAVLNSPCINFTNQGGGKIYFFYHMNGSNVGWMQLQASIDNGANWTVLWGAGGISYSDKWIQQHADLSPYAGKSFKLRFVVTMNSGPGGDIALDDLKLTSFSKYQAPVLSDENYILSRTYQRATSNPTSILADRDVIEEVTYFDGLGRPKQQVSVKASPDSKDIITHIKYDEFGRSEKDWLPFKESSGAAGSYRSSAVEVGINNYYYNNYSDDFPTATSSADINPFSQKRFESSPLGRVMEQGAPGEDWKVDPANDNDHTIKFKYETNVTNEVRLYRVNLDNDYTPTLENSSTASFYPPNELYKIVTKDENWIIGKNHTTEEFTDKQGRVILKRNYADMDVNGDKDFNDPGENEVAHDTYYVYDDFGNLTYVLPPKSEPNLSKPDIDELKELCYQYKYDTRNRLVEKKLPGKEVEFIIYNKLDQPVMTQDGNQRAKTSKEWLFTRYDAFGRVTYTGNSVDNRTRVDIQNEADSYPGQLWVDRGPVATIGGTSVYYSNNGLPLSTVKEVLTVNYYDDYDFPQSLQGISLDTESWGVPLSDKVKGLPTFSQSKVLGTSLYVRTVIKYDMKGRETWKKTKNDYLQTTHFIAYKLDFIGKILDAYTWQNKGDQPETIYIDHFDYDHQGRLLSQGQMLKDYGFPVEIIAENTYDELGQLATKGIGNAAGRDRLQYIDYSYNIRGWLRGINNPDNLGTNLFGFKINYNDATAGGTALFNSNISGTRWNSKSMNNTNNPVSNSYIYNYDALNRIIGAIDNTGNYNLGGISYDKMGNLLSLQRQGHLDANVSLFGNMDQLRYTYNQGNQLSSVEDLGTSLEGFKDGNKGSLDYGYDFNGNLTSDANKGITSVLYNHLNMPSEIKFNGSNTQKINYTYSADGIKLRKATNNGGTISTTDYASNFIYENNTLIQFYQPEGYVEPKGSSWQYVYQYKDIWGNTRITYADDNNSGSVTSSEIRKEQNYYPFGLEHKGYNSSSYGVKNNLKTYQGQEFTEDLGLNIHEWKYRMSDPSIGRFWQIDPLAKKFYYNSPYAFQENKLGSGIELEGLENVSWSKLSTSVGAKIEQAKNFIFNQIKYDMQTIDNEGNYHSATLQSARQSGLEQNKYFADTREMVQSVTNNSDGSIQYGKDFQLSDNPDASQKLSLNLDVGFKEQTGEVSMPLMGGVKVLSKTEGDWKANLTLSSAGGTVIIGPKLEAEYTQSATFPIPGLPGVSIGGKINAEKAASDLQNTSQNIINANNGNGVILNPYFNPFQQ